MIKIDQIRFLGGQAVDVGGLTVVVGPNNSGKSLLLREISDFITGQNHSAILLHSITSAVSGSIENLLSELGVKYKSEQKDRGSFFEENPFEESVSVSGSYSVVEKIEAEIKQGDPLSSERFRTLFGKSVVTRIRTEDRLSMAKQRNATDPSLLRHFYDRGRQEEDRINIAVKKVFNVSVRLDVSELGKIGIRVGDDFSAVPLDPRDARVALQALPLLDEQGDGLKSFVTTLLILRTSRRPVILLDEPEAFLHPPQALEIGRLIAEEASAGRAIICATHSVDVLRGMMNRFPSLRIVRISRTPEQSSLSTLSAEEVASINQNPLLASSRVLDAVFYKGAVILEADSDRAFYQKVALGNHIGDDVHYVHAHNKQTIYKLLQPYRTLSVRAAAVVDFDILRNSSELTLLLKSAGCTDTNVIGVWLDQIRNSLNAAPDSVRLTNLQQAVASILADDTIRLNQESDNAALLSTVRRIKRALDDSDSWALAKHRGVNALTPEGRKAFAQVDQLARQYGVFIVPVGDLESWLEELGFSRLADKSKWIAGALLWLNENDLPAESSLTKFVADIHSWITS